MANFDDKKSEALKNLYVDELKGLQGINWDDYKSFGLTPEKIAASGQAEDLLRGKRVKLYVQYLLPDGKAIGSSEAKPVQLKRDKDGNNSLYVNTRRFSEEQRPRVYYGVGDKYYELHDDVKKQLLDGGTVLLEDPKDSKKPAYLLEWDKRNDVLDSRPCTSIKNSISKMKFSKDMSEEQIEAFSRGEEITPKGWKNAIKFSPVEGGYVYANAEKEAQREQASQSEAPQETVSRSHGRGRG